MNNYESIIIINDEISEERKEEVVNKFTTFLNDNGNVTKVEDLGKKRLAYEVKKHQYGYYFIFEFDTESSNIAELERLYRITDEVLKFITIKREN